MASIPVMKQDGTKAGEHDLDAAVFDAQVNVPVMHQVVVAGLAAARSGTHSTKTRAEVSGGGVKPWRQKGTGRARHGSTRSPIWTGGGISHGPKPRDYGMRVNKKMKKLALRSALTDAAREERIRVLEGISFEGPKTADAVAVLGSLQIRGRVLLVLGSPDEVVEKSFRNLPYVKIDYPGNLSTYDVVEADWVVFTKDAIEAVKA